MNRRSPPRGSRESPTRAGELLDLRGRGAVVAGGAGGIGRAVVRRFSDAGARVVSLDLVDDPEVEGQPAFRCDLSELDQVEGALVEVDRRLESLEIVVHCAGICRDGVIWKMDERDWNEVLAVNLDSAFHLLRCSIPRLRENGGGSIVLVSSINGERGKFGQSNYAASKAGLIGLARSTAREVGRFGIRVNVVSPGMIESPMTCSLSNEVRRAAAEESALGKIGEPDDVARVILFLASEASRHVTGQVIRVDGGQCIG